jgi:hypothetical protein
MSAENARKTVAQALAPSADEVDHYVEYMTMLADAEEASAMAERAIRVAQNARDLLDQCFARAGAR